MLPYQLGERTPWSHARNDRNDRRGDERTQYDNLTRRHTLTRTVDGRSEDVLVTED